MYRILVVDDEQSILKALSMGLSSEDFEVDVAADGTSGILPGGRKEYDILIADLCLPDMDGLEVIKEIKPHSPEMIPIVITGKGSKESSIRAGNAIFIHDLSGRFLEVNDEACERLDYSREELNANGIK